MRLDLSRYRDITPHHRGAVVDAFSASTTGVDGAPLTVCLKFFRRARMPIDDAFERRFVAVVARSAGDSSARVARPFDFGLTPEGPAFVVPLVGGTSLRRIVERFAEHGEPVPTALAVHVALDVLGILEEHAARRTAHQLPLGENGHGSVSLSAIRFDTSGHTLLTEPNMWSVFGDDASTRRTQASARRYVRERSPTSGSADERDDVYALGVCLRVLVAHSDGGEKATRLAAFVERCASSTGYESLSAARAALLESFPETAHRAAIVSWLASQSTKLDNHDEASASQHAVTPSAHQVAVVTAVPAPRVSQAPAVSSAPLHRPRSLDADRSRVVIEQSGSTWPFFVLGIVVGFAATFGYALMRAAS